jgi:polygalacturonase
MNILRWFLVLFSGAVWAAAAPSAASFNVREFGAVGDGSTKDTAAISRAVSACAAAGGGTVHFPAGRYLTGSIELVSNLTLDIEAGAELLYSPDPADSPLVRSRWEGTSAWTYAPLLHADGKENIAIVGRGTINGQGENWWWRNGKDRHHIPSPEQVRRAQAAQSAWKRLIDRIDSGEMTGAADFQLAAEYLRPALVETYRCRHVLVDGVTITNSPFWILHPVYTEDMVVHGISFLSSGPNGDGIDIDSCRNVRISDCFFRTGDDCIVIKSGRDADGRRTAFPTEHVTVANCVMYEGHGAIVIGSETSGDIRDIAATNIVAKGTDCGIRIKSNRGRGGIVENVVCENFVIEDAVKQGIEITTLYTHVPEEPVSERTPIFRNFAMSHLTIARATEVASIHGLPEKAVEDLRFSDISASGKIGFVCDYANGVALRSVHVDAASGSAFDFSHIKGLVLADVTTRTPGKAAPVIRLLESDRVWLRESQAAPGTARFLEIDGEKPSVLRLTDNDLSAAAIPVFPVAPAP